MTDYNLKIHPMLKSVPSIGYTELAQGSEGLFTHKAVKAYNILFG